MGGEDLLDQTLRQVFDLMKRNEVDRFAFVFDDAVFTVVRQPLWVVESHP